MTYYYKDNKIDDAIDDNFVKHVKDLLKDDSDQITVKRLTKAFVEGAVKKAGESKISEGLSFLTAGVSDINALFKKVKEFSLKKI